MPRFRSPTFGAPAAAALLLLAACGGSSAGGRRIETDYVLVCPPCPTNAVCVDDPRDPCDPALSFGCAGICVPPVACGGFAGVACPANQTCVDDPRDTCVPALGGADCPGFCAPAH